MRLDQFKGRPSVLFAALAFCGVAVTGCSGDPADENQQQQNQEDDVCEEDDDCEEGQICDPYDEQCVDEGEFSCEQHEDCDDDRLCELPGDDQAEDQQDGGDADEGACVPIGEFDCELGLDCRDEQYCDDGTCVFDEIEDEDYTVSFTAERDTDGTVELGWAHSDGELIEGVDTGDIDCSDARLCAVTPDVEHLLVVEESGEAQDASLVALDGEQPPAVDGQPEPIAEGVEDVRLRGDGIAYKRLEEDNYIAYYQPFDGDPEQFATLHSTVENTHRWDVAPESGVAFQAITPDLTSLQVRVGSTEEPLEVEDTIYQADLRDHFGHGIGSIYEGMEVPMAASQDGRLVAFQTNGAAAYEACETDDDCSRPNHECGEAHRCVSLEPHVKIVDVEHLDNLKDQKDCLGHDECGPYHRCDSGTDDFAGGQCAPQRVSLGIDERRGGCDATHDAGTFDFTDVEPPLTFGENGRLYFVAARNCQRGPGPDEANIPRTSIIELDPETGDYEELFGNVDNQDFDLDHCRPGGDGDLDAGVQIDEADQCFTTIIEGVTLSPDENDLVYQGTNPAAGHGRAGEAIDVWRVRRDGDSASWLGGRSSLDTVYDVQVH